MDEYEQAAIVAEGASSCRLLLCVPCNALLRPRHMWQSVHRLLLQWLPRLARHVVDAHVPASKSSPLPLT